MQNEPFNKLLNQIAELLQTAYDNAQKPVSPEKEAEINAKLDILEKQVEDLTKMNDQFAEEANLSDYVLQTMIEDESSTMISPENRKLLKKAESLKSEAQAASQDLQKAASDAKASGKRLTDQDKKEKKGKSRKGKFRSMGGVKNWKAL